MLGVALLSDKNTPHPRSAIDLGAGTGLATDTILQTTNPEQITVVDISERMVERLRDRFAGRPGFAVVRDTIDNYLDERAEPADLIVAMGVLNYAPSLPRTVELAAAKLNPLGRLAFTYTPRIPGDAEQSGRLRYYQDGPIAQRYTAEEVRDAVQQSGLHKMTEQEAPHRPDNPTSALGKLIVAQMPGVK